MIHQIWQKSCFLAQNTIFFKVADIVRKIDIWPENDILGVLEWFGTLIRYHGLSLKRPPLQNGKTEILGKGM